MSTQHPDNVNPPFFAESPEMGGEDEVQEAYYVFSHLGCEEQMWDCEGKEVDDFVVKKLLTNYPNFFQSKRLGKDLFITPRVPNPTVERDEAKILLETLESIPRSFDTARMFYQDDIPPVFEVILPMTTSWRCLDRVYRYYRDFVVGKQTRPFREGDITIAEWIGNFQPEEINVIPLFEDLEHMLAADTITEMYLKDKKLEYQRVFLARSDPSMNYGYVSSMLMNMVALNKLHQLQERIGVHIYPIIGVGSAPFRGNFKPSTVDRIMKEYPSVQTFTVQSAFKYDHPHEEVREGIAKVKERDRGKPRDIDEERARAIIHKITKSYMDQIIRLAPLINEASRFVPRRRKRKLHIGLFGYSRNVKGVRLPRAISLCCAMYSIGLPPEVLGLDALNEKDLEFLRESSPSFDANLMDALRYLNQDSLRLLPEGVGAAIRRLELDVGIDAVHKDISTRILEALSKGQHRGLEEDILRAANIRGFLG
ncbi:MAG: phosphoenolpyruvate carboxylase [Methanomassiliicoccales archaeon]